MSKTIVTVAAGIALVLIASATTAYVSMFGATPISSHDHWGQFGDYFGGLLNPLFAMLAFLALLWSITLQAQEFRSASALLSSQAESAREQLSLLKRDRVREDLLYIIKDIDKRLDQFLELNVSPSGSNPQVTVGLLLSEARRIANGGGDSPAYSEFVRLAQTPGTVVEAPVREAIYLVGQMRSFLEQYSHFESGSYLPMIVYYANKCYRLLDMLEDIGGLPNDSRRFFATVSDPHG